MLDIVVPVYNEDKLITKLLDEINKEIKSDKKVYIIYDFPEDKTVPVVKSVVSKYPFEIVLEMNTYGRGVLNAIKYGMNISKDEMVLVMMADLSDKLDVVDEMYDLIRDGYDLVCGSRYIKGGKQVGAPAFKSFLSRMAGLSLHILSHIPTHDCSNSFKMYRKSMLENISIESNGGFELGLEILVKAYVGGYKITEVPSEWYEREAGESHFKLWEWLPHYLHWYFYCIKNSRLRGKNCGK